MICAPQAVAPTAPNKALSTATTIFAIVRQFFIFAAGICVTTAIAGARAVSTAIAGAIAGVLSSLRLSGVNTVLWCLLHAASADERLLTLAVAVGLDLRHKQHVQTFHVLAHAELGCAVGALALDADLKRSEAIQLYSLRVLQLVLHSLNQLADYGQDISSFQCAVALHD